ncbi:primary-amine oxidase [Streptomyces capparidis]
MDCHCTGETTGETASGETNGDTASVYATALQTVPAPEGRPPAAHPLDPLTAEEYTTARQVLEKAGRVGGTTRFPLVVLDEPHRAETAAFRPGDPLRRRARVTLLDTATGAAAEAVVDLADEKVASWRDLDPVADGQPSILFEEYERCDAIVKAHPGWQRAMAERGITDHTLTVCTPLSVGHYDRPEEKGRRVLRSLTFLRCDEGDNPWSHPVAGLVVDVDIIAGEVIRLVDSGPLPVPTECGRCEPEFTGPARGGVRPLEITQPQGPSFSLDGNLLTWQNWSVRVGFNAREGLVLHDLAYRDGERTRPVLTRASIAEMAVPYADPDPSRSWICYFDAGEYLIGRNANALRLGCDCLGEITYLDAVLPDDQGRPYLAPNAICIHEEDFGLQWKHTNVFDGHAESRRARRLVVSFIATIGNYDYGFYWYLYTDGAVGFDVKATGIVFTGAVEPGSASPYGTEIAPGLLAPHHQHLFCARLDMAVDGPANTVEELDVVAVPGGEDNPLGNAFTTRTTPITDSGDGGRLADPAAGRRWRITNPGSRNRMGQPVAYTLVPQTGPVLLAAPGSSVSRRAAFGTRHLWVTRYAPDRRFPAGDYPNQHAGGAGVAAWTAPGEPLDATDLTVWHVFGPTHLPRLEDWPVMPVDASGFTLKPTGFFDRNPALDLPREAQRGCH